MSLREAPREKVKLKDLVQLKAKEFKVPIGCFHKSLVGRRLEPVKAFSASVWGSKHPLRRYLED